jgi:hypothetical protein
MAVNKETVSHLQMLSTMDSMGIVNTAEYCAEGDEICELEEEDALMNTLESQAHLLEASLEEIQNLVYALSDEDDPLSNENSYYQTAAGGGDLSGMTFMGLVNTARYCIDEGCDEEYREALVCTLTHQYHAWSMRLNDIVSSLSRLYHHRSNYAPDLHGQEVDSLMESIGYHLSMEDYDSDAITVPAGDFDDEEEE